MRVLKRRALKENKNTGENENDFMAKEPLLFADAEAEEAARGLGEGD